MIKQLTGESLHDLFAQAQWPWITSWSNSGPEWQKRMRMVAAVINQKFDLGTAAPRNVSVTYTGRQIFHVWREAAKRHCVKVGFYDEQDARMLNAFDAFAADLSAQLNSVVDAMVADHDNHYRALEARQDKLLDENNDVEALLRRALELVGERE